MLTITAQIPGKIMLAGEYAVLYGGDALAFTVDRLMEISVSRHPERFCLMSNLWQQPVIFGGETPPEQAASDPFIETVLLGAQKCGLDGATVDVRSALMTRFGIGSSSALRLGVLLALRGLDAEEGYFSESPREAHWEQASLALELQKRQQQAASGYDIATQLIGGLVRFSPENSGASRGLDCRMARVLSCRPDDPHPFVEFWAGGAGAPSVTVVRDTVSFIERHAMVQRMMHNAALMVDLLQEMCQKNSDARQVDEWIRLCREHREIFQASPHFPGRIFDRLTQLAGFDRTFTVKTTGAGGEDALMLIGETKATAPARTLLDALGWYPLDARFTPQGARLIRSDA